VNIVKNLNAENAELMDRVNELSDKVEQLEESNRRLSDKLNKYETIQKADIASIKTVIELMRKELEVTNDTASAFIPFMPYQNAWKASH